MRKRKENAATTESRLMSADALAAYLSVGRQTATRIGIEAGAMIKIGRRTLYDRQKINSYIDAVEA